MKDESVYIRTDPEAYEMLKAKNLRLKPAATYNQVIAEIKQGDDWILSLPRDKKQAENIQLSLKMKDPSYKASGGPADQGQAVWNICVLNNTFVRRVAMDSEIGLPEVYIA